MSEQSWHDSLPDDLKGAPIFKPAEDGTVKSIEQVVMDLTNLTQVAGNSLRIPGPDAGADDVASFQAKAMDKIPGLMTAPNLEDPDSVSAHFAKMGKPTNAEDYKVPEGLDNAGEVKALAHAMNLTQQQLDAQLAISEAGAKRQQDALAAQYSEQVDVIKGEWGAAYEQNRTAVGKLLKESKLTPPELVSAFDSGQLPATMMRYLLEMSNLGAEGSTFQDQTDGKDLIPDVSEALQQLNEVENRLFAPDMRPGNPEYPILVGKRDKLMRQAYPDASLDANQMRA